jgi:hypothetical protein
MQFMECTYYHTVLQGNIEKPAGEVVQICRNGFRQDYWAKVPFNLNTNNLPTSAHNLFGRFLYESYAGETDWLVFHANERLTQELAVGVLINNVRSWYYSSGGDRSGITSPRYFGGDTSMAIRYNFGMDGYLASMFFDIGDSIWKGSLPLEFVLGSFKFQVMQVDEDRLGFRIDNDMTIESGTHIRGREPELFRGSVEELIELYPYLAERPLSEVIKKQNQYGYRVISILSSQTTEQTHGMAGGGNLYQTFAWTEQYNECNLAGRLPQQIFPFMLDIQVWGNYDKMTEHPGNPFP